MFRMAIHEYQSHSTIIMARETLFISYGINTFFSVRNIILFMNQQREKQFKKQLENWLKDEDIQVFCLFLANKEASLSELLDQEVFELKRKQKVSDFKNFMEKYLEGQRQQSNEYSNEANLISLVKQHLDNIQLKSQKTEQTILFNVQKSLSSFFVEMVKKKQYTTQLQRNKEGSLEQKFKSFFNQLYVLIWKKKPEKGLVESIIKFGTFQAIKHNRCFTNQDTKELFQKMLQLSNSYKSLKLYGGKDLELLRHTIFTNLKQELTNVKASAQLIMTLLRQIMKNPLSNCIANCQQLSQKAKRDYYLSQFYQSGKLFEYAELCLYPQSLTFKAIDQISSILRYISQTIMITQEIVSKAFNFDLIGLFKIQNVNPMKKEIFNFVKNQCPNYYSLSLLGRYKQKNQLKDNSNRKLQLKFALRKMFLEVGLKFSEWERVEDQLMSRKECIIHKLQLTLEEKQKLRRFYWENLESYFHSEQKQLKYNQQLEDHLLGPIMNSSISQKNMKIIQSLIKEISQTRTMTGLIAEEELTPSFKRQLASILKESSFYQEYVANKGLDLRETEYSQKLQIKKEIYQKNFENQVQQSYGFIQQKVNQQYKQKVAGLQQKKPFINPNPEDKTSDILPKADLSRIDVQEPQRKPLVMNKKDERLQQRDKLIQRFKEILQKFCSSESKIMQLKESKFRGRELEFFERLIIANPFFNQKIQSSILETNVIGARKVVSQCQELKKMSPDLISLVSQYQLIDQEIQSSDLANSSARVTKREILSQRQEQNSSKKQMQLLIEEFYGEAKKNSQSILAKVIADKFKGEYEKLITKILQTNYLADATQDDLKKEFDFTKIQMIKIKKQVVGLTNGVQKNYAQEYQIIKKKLVE